MKAVIDLLGKKRFWLPALGSGIIAIITTAMSQLGVPAELIGWVVTAVGALFGIGGLNNAAADFGKAKAQIESDSKAANNISRV